MFTMTHGCIQRTSRALLNPRPAASRLVFRAGSSSAARKFHWQSASHLSLYGTQITAVAGNRSRQCRVRASSERPQEFGYSRKDVILIGAGVLGGGYGLYYGIQALGVDASMAGVYAQLVIFVTVLVGWVATYILRVANKDMTYVKQLQAYEEAVMQKRLEEMTEEEVKSLQNEVEKEKGEYMQKP